MSIAALTDWKSMSLYWITIGTTHMDAINTEWVSMLWLRVKRYPLGVPLPTDTPTGVRLSHWGLVDQLGALSPDWLDGESMLSTPVTSVHTPWRVTVASGSALWEHGHGGTAWWGCHKVSSSSNPDSSILSRVLL